jgi:hypothetical protein
MSRYAAQIGAQQPGIMPRSILLEIIGPRLKIAAGFTFPRHVFIVE